jgi:hypothetical protein
MKVWSAQLVRAVAQLKVEVAAQEIRVPRHGNLLEGMTPAGKWLEKDMLGVKPARMP